MEVELQNALSASSRCTKMESTAILVLTPKVVDGYTLKFKRLENKLSLVAINLSACGS